MNIKTVVRDIRALGYTQRQISDETGIPQGTVSRIESGKHKDPRYSTAEKLIELLKLLQAA